MQAKPFFHLMRLHRPLPILLLLWPVYAALFLASQGFPSLQNFTVFGLGAVVMRSAGCVVNDLADRHIDPLVARTQNRPLATGEASVYHAYILLFILLFIAFLLAISLSFESFSLACIAFILAMLYPFSKRWFPCPQLILGLTYNMGILMAFAQVQQVLSPQAFLLYMGCVFWTLAYDTFYAQADAPFDQHLDIHSSVLTFAPYTSTAIVIFQSLAYLCFSGLVVWVPQPLTYALWMCGVPVLFFRQHLHARSGSMEGYITAFSSNHWVGLLLLLAIASNF